MRRMRWLLLIAALNGCSSPASIAFGDFDGAMLAAKCARLVRCDAFADDASCTAYFRDRPDRDRAAAVAAGKVRYDGELAALCADAIAAQSCDMSARSVRRAPQSCATMFRGTLAEAAACELDEECVSGTCTPDEPCQVGMCCPGTCAPIAPKAADTEACMTTVECGVDLYCGIDHVCHPLEAVDGECFVDATCDYGLRCNTTTRRCVVAAATGAACPDEVCADVDARCVAGTCIDVAVGTACTGNGDCSEFERCDETMHCAIKSTIGGACGGEGCAGEAWCDTGTCAELRANGQMCNADSECATSYCLEGPVFDMCADEPICI